MPLRKTLLIGGLSILLLIPLVALVLPLEAVAHPQTTGGGGAWFPGQPLVPQCFETGDGGPYCQACDLVHLVNHLLAFAIYLSASVATLMFVYAGFLYVTAAANTENLQKARSVFTSVFIGFILVLTAWLIVDLVLTVLTPHKNGFGFWADIQCERFPTLQDAMGSTVTSGSVGTRRCEAAASGLCSAASLSGTFGDRAQDASKVCLAESGGRAAISDRGSTDRIADGRAFSVGLFQINMTVGGRPLSGEACGLSSGQTLDCSKAFSGRNTSATVVDEDLYTQCRTALERSACNMQVARQLWQGAGQRFRTDWTAARECGVN